MAFETDWEALLSEQIRTGGRWFFRLAYGVLRDVDAAEDACQQAFLKGWELQGRIRDGQALRSWLARVVINESLYATRRRRLERRFRHEHRTAPGDATNTVQRAELHDAFRSALRGLPEQTQAVVVLRLVQGMTGNEVKSLLGCSASEVSRRLHTGMEHLRQQLAGSLDVD